MKRLLCLLITLVLMSQSFIVFADDSEGVTVEIPADVLGLMTAISFVPENIDTSRDITNGEFADLLANTYAWGDLVLEPEDRRTIKEINWEKWATGYTGSIYPSELEEGRQRYEGSYNVKYTTSTFPDVPSSHEYFESVELLVAMGVIEPSSYLFKPSEPIAFDDAVKMIIRCIGIEYMLERYPSYLALAKKYGILDNINAKSGTNVPWADALNMMYNMFSIDMSEFVSTYDHLSDKAPITFMRERMGFDFVHGIVTDDGISGIASETELDYGYVKIGDMIFEQYVNAEDPVSHNVLKNYAWSPDILGRTVNGYYMYDEDRDKNVLFYVSIDDDEDVLVIEDEQLISYSNRTYKYDNGKRTKTYTLSADFVLIYNGVSVLDYELFTEELMKPETGSVTIMRRDGKDIVSVSSYRTVVAEQINHTEEIIFDKHDTNNNVVLTDEKYRVFNEKNAEVMLSGIGYNNILSVAQSIDGKYTIIRTSSTQHQGVLERIMDDEYIIDGVSYELNPHCAKYCNIKACLGSEVIVSLDYEGKIAYIEKTEANEYTYGILLGFGRKNEFSMPRMKIYTENNVDAVYELASKVSLDGMVYKLPGEYDRLRTVLANSNNNVDRRGTDFKYQLLGFKTNSEGQISRLDTTATSGAPDGSLRRYSLFDTSGKETSTVTYYKFPPSLNYQTLLRPDTKVFVMPGKAVTDSERSFSDYAAKDGITANEIFVTTAGQYLKANRISLKGAAFVVDEEDTQYAKTLVIYSDYYEDMRTSSERTVSFVTSVETCFDADGNLVNALRVIGADKKLHTLYTTSEDVLICEGGRTVTSGDVIKYGVNKYGTIEPGNLVLLYDNETDTITQDTTFLGRYNGWVYSYVQHWWVYDRADGNQYVQVSLVDPSETEPLPHQLLWIDFEGSLKFEFDKSTLTYREISDSDLSSYMKNKSAAEIFASGYNHSAGFVITYVD